MTRLSDRLDCASLVDDASEVLRSRTHIERETRSRADQWFLMRIFPYRTLDDRIDGVIITFLDITRLKETETRLKESQQQIEALTEKLATVVAEQMERVRRLASEVLITEQKVQQAMANLLHDELQQVLFIIQMQVEEIRQMLLVGEPVLVERMQKLREAADLAFNITRQVAVDLKPPVLLSEDFTESLDWLAALMKDRHGLEVEVKIVMRSNWPGQEVSTLLFQTVRELLFNVVKHAGVNQAQVEVVAEGGRLSLTVSDQGQGFDVAAALVARPHRGGLGLFGIRSRLELLGGQFSIESRADLGTRATIVVLV
ncbi:MAG: PAS domain-containing protein [Chloroflexi bacterium]|nr:PAS domain-containing protein [Chloroflexota bacterium]